MNMAISRKAACRRCRKYIRHITLPAERVTCALVAPRAFSTLSTGSVVPLTIPCRSRAPSKSPGQRSDIEADTLAAAIIKTRIAILNMKVPSQAAFGIWMSGERGRLALNDVLFTWGVDPYATTPDLHFVSLRIFSKAV